MPGKGIRPAVLASVMLALGAATAAAEPPWLAPDTISALGERIEIDGVGLAVNPAGDAVAVWVAHRDGAGVVRASTRDARGSWSPPVDLSGTFNQALGIAPVPTIGSGGDAAVAWLDDERRLTVAVRAGATGSWRTPEKASTPLDTISSWALAVEPSGTLVTVWSRASAVESTVRPASTGTWTAPQPLSNLGASAIFGGLVANRAGAMVAWWGSRDGSQASVRPPGGHFSPPVGIPGGAPLADVAIGPDEQLLIARARTGEDGRTRVIEAAVRPPGAAVGPFQTISSESSTRVASPRVMVDGRGNAIMAWERTVIPGPRRTVRLTTIRLAERPADGPWGPARALVPQHAAFRGIALNAAGAAVALFDRPRRRADVVEAALRPGPGLPFRAPEDVIAYHFFAATSRPAIDDEGVAAVAYLLGGRAGGQVQSILRARSLPGDVRLTAAQLRTNQRISQAAVRRANAVETRLAEGLTGADIRPGALRAAAFATGVRVSGHETGALTAPGPRRPLVVSVSRRDEGGAVRLTAAQLRINQRIAQAAVRRANRLAALLAGGLTGAHVADGTIGLEHLAPGFAIEGATGGPPNASPVPGRASRHGEPGRVTLSTEQLRINQRISQAALRRLNSLVARLERGLPGSSFAPGSITAHDLAPDLRR